MTSLVPRLWSELSEWFEQDSLLRHNNTIRLEDHITDTEYTIRAELPGVDPDKDVHVSVSDGILTIRGERREEKQTRYRSEFRYGSFERSVRLPSNAEEQGIRANYHKGILEITVPLRPQPEARRIEINTS